MLLCEISFPGFPLKGAVNKRSLAPGFERLALFKRAFQLYEKNGFPVGNQIEGAFSLEIYR